MSAFASSVGVLGAFIPLAVPFLLQGEVATLSARCCRAQLFPRRWSPLSPYSTNGALVMANAKGVDQDAFYRQLLVYGAVIVAVIPPLAWLVLIVIGG